jgi:hypothetical protein
MRDLLEINAELTAEARQILHEHGLLELCEKYGCPFVTGSYTLGLMARRDLDVNIENGDMALETWFRFCGELAVTLKMSRVLYLNEFVERHPRLPLGLYAGGNTRIRDRIKNGNWISGRWMPASSVLIMNIRPTCVPLWMMTKGG